MKRCDGFYSREREAFMLIVTVIQREYGVYFITDVK